MWYIARNNFAERTNAHFSAQSENNFASKKEPEKETLVNNLSGARSSSYVYHDRKLWQYKGTRVTIKVRPDIDGYSINKLFYTERVTAIAFGTLSDISFGSMRASNRQIRLRNDIWIIHIRYLFFFVAKAHGPCRKEITFCQRTEIFPGQMGPVTLNGLHWRQCEHITS